MTKAAQHRKWNSRIGRQVTSAALTLAVALGLGAVSTHSAQAQTYQPQAWNESVLYPFTWGTDGANPGAGVFFGAKGTLCGTTQYGGLSGCSSKGLNGCGVVFKMSSKGTEAVLYHFTGGGGRDGSFRPKAEVGIAEHELWVV